jgi:hypothetical protein
MKTVFKWLYLTEKKSSFCYDIKSIKTHLTESASLFLTKYSENNDEKNGC